jgi:hypothetical protein
MQGELRWRGSNSISVSGHHNIKEGILITGRRGGEGEGLDNLLMSMVPSRQNKKHNTKNNRFSRLYNRHTLDPHGDKIAVNYFPYK